MRGFSRSRALTTLLCLLPIALVQAQRNPQNAQAAYLSGVVQGAQGPEVGVSVIAETKDLPTNVIEIVVTDDRGRFMLHLWGNPPYDPADPHNPMLDSNGRVWMTSKIRANQFQRADRTGVRMD
jgi:hypothetical protein